MVRLGIIVTLSILLFSCRDKSNIEVSGQVLDAITGKPIENAEVVVLCWYWHSIDDASFKKQTLITDKSGNYKAHFDKGHQVDIASKSNAHQPGRSYNTLSTNEINVVLKLDQIKNNPTLLTSFNTDHSSLTITKKSTFLRVRIPGIKRDSFDYNNILTFGFNVFTFETTTDTLQCDIWFRPQKKAETPTVLTTGNSGGLIPIFNSEIKSSVLFEKFIAPESGYLMEYKLTGNEAGFFVKCRDGKTYAKILLEQSSIDISSPDGNGGFYKEFGKNFSVLYQPNGTTDLSYSRAEIDLEAFLVDFRYN